MIVAGIGSRKGVAAAEVIAAIDAALAAHGLSRDQLDRLATAPLKSAEPAFRAASLQMGIELVVADAMALGAASARTETHTALSTASARTPSVSEASALAVAGSRSRLLGPRLVLGHVTCAIATDGAAP